MCLIIPMAVSILTNSLKAQEDVLLDQLRAEVDESRQRIVDIPEAFSSEIEMRREVDRFLTETEELLGRIKAAKGSTENLYLIDELLARFSRISSQMFLSNSVMGGRGLKKAVERESLRLDEFWIDSFLTDEDIFIELRKHEVAKKRLTEQEAAHLEHILTYFRFYHLEDDVILEGRSETELTIARAEHKQRLQNLSKTADRVALEFDRNVEETKKALILTTKELEGLPQWFLEKTRTSEGDHRVDVHIWWQYDLVIQSARRANTRKKVLKAKDSIAMELNETLLESLLTTRQGLAWEMALDSWLEHQLVGLNLTTEAELREFLEAALEGNRARFRAEQAIIRKWKRKQTNQKSVKIFAWDWKYYLAKELEESFGFSAEESRKYFMFEVVLEGLLAKIQDVFQVRIEAMESPEGWPESVRAFKFFQAGSDEALGVLLLDPYPRDGKDGWFFNMELSPRRQTLDGKVQLPVTYVNLNFTPPQDGRPSLLSTWDVVTLFHEFGHALHDLFTKVQFSSFSGTNSYEDLVETPSAFMELWANDAAFMKSLSQHFESGEKMPEEWFEHWSEIMEIGAGHEMQRRIVNALIDLELHSKDVKLEKVSETAAGLLKRHFYAPVPGSNPIVSDTYLSGGYDGLVWIYVYGMLLADQFSSAFGDNIFDPVIAEKYVGEVLAVGGLRSTEAIAKRFLGKKFSACKAALEMADSN